MVGSHKILTVSYGTFSCTLEGFDDSFGTMKAIAEYFRDLAAEDRYFGAVPPTPDAEMLARIAEREIARRVEARMEASGIVLRAAAAGDWQAPAPPAPAVEAAVAEARPAEPSAPEAAPVMAVTAMTDTTPVAAVAAERVAREAQPAMPPLPPEPAAPPAADPGGMAAKLERIRAVVGRGDAAPEQVEPAPDLPSEAVAAMPDLGPASGTDLAPSEAEAEAEAAPREAEEPAPVALGEASTAPPPKPARPAPVRPRVIRMRRAEFEQAVAAGMLVEEGPEPVAVQPDVAQAQSEAPFPHSGSLPPEAEAELQAELAALAAETPDSLEEPARPAEPVMAGITDAVAAAAAAAVAAVADAAASALRPAEEAPVASPGAGREERAPEPAGADAARAVGDLIASLGDGATPAGAETGHGSDAGGQPAPVVAGFGTADAWTPAEEPAREPANLFAEADRDEDALSDEPEEEDEPRSGRGARHAALAGTPETDEAAMSRILSRTDAALEDPEAQRRREAIAQLKAAVAATEAARRLGEEAPPAAEERADAFRDDLRQAVRPRRPVPAAELRAERPRPAPLKLVASQRVDLPAPEAESLPAASSEEPVRPAAVHAVRPRRVTLDGLAAQERTAEQRAEGAARVASSFSAFAAEMGAVSLTDVLEAAAVYTSVVEGAEDFSRPQIIEKLRQVRPEAVTREDGLRSFGILLRQGRITRVRGGRFAVAEDSRFHPGRRMG